MKLRYFAWVRERIGKPMAIVLFEKNKGEVLTVATIRDELGSRFQISGMGTPERANDLALLLRAGSLAAPCEGVSTSDARFRRRRAASGKKLRRSSTRRDRSGLPWRGQCPEPRRRADLPPR